MNFEVIHYLLLNIFWIHFARYSEGIRFKYDQFCKKNAYNVFCFWFSSEIFLSDRSISHAVEFYFWK